MRENALIASLGVLASATMAWLGLYGFAWNDYEVEARPSFQALVHGHLLLFLRDAPVYGGSLVERAPFALIPSVWGGGELAVYRMVALPCLLAAAGLAVWLVAEMRSQGRSRLARAIALGVCVANPLTLRALELGHPEDLLGGVLCVAAVLLALRGRPLWAGLVLGAAIANKEWAVLAVGPVLLALPARRALCLAVAATVTGLVLAPLALVGSGAFLASARGTAAPTSAIFQPWQVWWFLGHHGPAVHGLFGALKPGFRTAPGWVGRVSHPLIVALSLPLAGLFWWRRRDETPPATDALGLLALLLLLRCMLDTWDVSYYPLPFLLALLAWETVGAPLASTPVNRRLPLLAASCTALAWVSFQWLPVHAGPDAQSVFFLAWTVPLAAALGVRLYAPQTAARLLGRAGLAFARAGALTAPNGALRRPRSAPWATR
ncbi:MAG: glycosyltransferase 87 family protein [Solirubrobacterales bacterium]